MSTRPSPSRSYAPITAWICGDDVASSSVMPISPRLYLSGTSLMGITIGGAVHPRRHDTSAGRDFEQRRHFGPGQMPPPAGLQVAQLDRTDRGADQARHRVTDLLEHAPHDVLSPFVEHDLDQRGPAEGVDQPERVDPGQTIFELYAGQQLAPDRTRQRAGDLGQVRLLHAVRRVG